MCVFFPVTGGEPNECGSAEAATSLERSSCVIEGDDDLSYSTGTFFCKWFTGSLDPKGSEV